MKKLSNKALFAIMGFLFLLFVGCSGLVWKNNIAAKKRLNYVQHLSKRVEEGTRPDILRELKELQALGFRTWEEELTDVDKKQCQCDSRFVGIRDDEPLFNTIFSVLIQKQVGIIMYVKNRLIFRADFYHRPNSL